MDDVASRMSTDSDADDDGVVAPVAATAVEVPVDEDFEDFVDQIDGIHSALGEQRKSWLRWSSFNPRWVYPFSRFCFFVSYFHSTRWCWTFVQSLSSSAGDVCSSTDGMKVLIVRCLWWHDFLDDVVSSCGFWSRMAIFKIVHALSMIVFAISEFVFLVPFRPKWR